MCFQEDLRVFVGSGLPDGRDLLSDIYLIRFLKMSFDHQPLPYSSWKIKSSETLTQGHKGFGRFQFGGWIKMTGSSICSLLKLCKSSLWEILKASFKFLIQDLKVDEDKKKFRYSSQIGIKPKIMFRFSFKWLF